MDFGGDGELNQQTKKLHTNNEQKDSYFYYSNKNKNIS